MSSYLPPLTWKVEYSLLLATPFSLAFPVFWFCLTGCSFSDLHSDSFSSPGWGVPQTSVLRLLFLFSTLYLDDLFQSNGFKYCAVNSQIHILCSDLSSELQDVYIQLSISLVHLIAQNIQSSKPISDHPATQFIPPRQ